jgi:hypothetical protein
LVFVYVLATLNGDPCCLRALVLCLCFPPGQEFYIIINLAVGGTGGSSVLLSLCVSDQRAGFMSCSVSQPSLCVSVCRVLPRWCGWQAVVRHQLQRRWVGRLVQSKHLRPRPLSVRCCWSHVRVFWPCALPLHLCLLFLLLLLLLQSMSSTMPRVRGCPHGRRALAALPCRLTTSRCGVCRRRDPDRRRPPPPLSPPHDVRFVVWLHDQLLVLLFAARCTHHCHGVSFGREPMQFLQCIASLRASAPPQEKSNVEEEVVCTLRFWKSRPLCGGVRMAAAVAAAAPAPGPTAEDLQLADAQQVAFAALDRHAWNGTLTADQYVPCRGWWSLFSCFCQGPGALYRWG